MFRGAHSPNFLATALLLLPPDVGAGAGGDGGASPSDGGGAGAGDQGGTGYERAQGGRSSQRGFDSRQPRTDSATPYKLTNDSLVDLGDGKPVKWSEAQQRYVPKAEHDRYRQAFDGSRQMLLDEGARLDKLAAALDARERAARAGGQQQQQAAKQDIVEELGGMGILDGATLARVVKDLRAQGLAPLATAFTRQQAEMQGMRAEINQLKGAAGPLAQQHQTQQFDQHIDKAIAAIPEVKGLSQPLSVYAAKHSVIREILSDLWLSYDPKTWKMEDFQRMASDRVAALVALVRADQVAAVEGAREKKRKFFAQGAAAHPSGQGRGFQMMNGAQIARESGLFDRNQST